VADVVVFLDGSFKEGRLVAKYVKFRGNFPPPLEIGFHSDTGFTLRDLLGTELTPTEQQITRWFNEQRDGWYETQVIIDGSGVKQRSAERALPRLCRASAGCSATGRVVGTDSATAAIPTPERSSDNAARSGLRNTATTRNARARPCLSGRMERRRRGKAGRRLTG
jgi:hypothetical protein